MCVKAVYGVGQWWERLPRIEDVQNSIVDTTKYIICHYFLNKVGSITPAFKIKK